MTLTRRSFLVGSAVAGAGALVGWSLLRPEAAEPQALRIPALIDAREQGQSITLQVQQGSTEFFPGRGSRTLGYNGNYLGPTLRVPRKTSSGLEPACSGASRVTSATRSDEPATPQWIVVR